MVKYTNMHISSCHIYLERNEMHKVHVPFPDQPNGDINPDSMRLEISTYAGKPAIEVISDSFYLRFIITRKGELKKVKSHPPTHE